jgi:hypothetical protein
MGHEFLSTPFILPYEGARLTSLGLGRDIRAARRDERTAAPLSHIAAEACWGRDLGNI